jgi:hypothetical protein
VGSPVRDQIDQLAFDADRGSGDVFNGGELPIAAGTDRQLLNRLWPMAHQGEHLGARQHDLHGSLRNPGGENRERHMRPDAQSCAEPTADERHEYTHAGWIDAECSRQRIARAMGILRGVMDCQRIAVPDRHRRKQADRIVRVLRSRVSLVHLHIGCRECSAHVPTIVVGCPWMEHG